MKQRIFCKDKNGRDLFYMDIYDYMELNSIWLTFSMGRKCVLNQETERLMRIIEERLVPQELREEFIQRLFRAIQNIPDIEQVYLPTSLLTKEGKYSEETYNTLEDIYKDYMPENFEPLTPFSGYPFDDICGHLFLKSKDEDVQQLTETEFSKITVHSKRLNSVYRFEQKPGCTYFNATLKSASESIEFYWMICEGRTSLIFLVRFDG
jgi:hypothetical protein